jgi:hypothetical protein
VEVVEIGAQQHGRLVTEVVRSADQLRRWSRVGGD